MTSNRYFFKMQLELLKRNIVLPVLAGVGFFFCLPLATMMALQQKLADIQMMEDSEAVYQGVAMSAKGLLSNGHVGVGFGMVIMATLSGILLFRYLHDRKQVDFYHSLPISRKKLFANLYVTGILAVIPLYIIMYMAALMIAFVMHGGQYLTVTLVTQTLFTNILFFLLFYSLAVFSTIVTGNTVIAVAVYGMVNFMLPVTFLMIDGLCRESFLTYAGSEWIGKLCTYTFPFLLYFQNNMLGMKIYTNVPGLSLSIGILAAIVLITALSLALFARRKSERAGNALAFFRMKTPIKCFLVLIIGYAMMFAFGGLAGEFWKIPGLFLGVLLVHMVMEMLYHMEIRAAFAHWKTMLGLLAFSILLLAGMKADLIGYDKKIPKMEEIQSVSLVDSYFGTLQMRTIKPLTEEDNIELVRKMAQYGVEHLQSLSENDEQMIYYTIEYTLKNGSEIKRQYNVPGSEEVFALAETLRFAEEYRKVEGNSVYDLELDKIHNIGMNIYSQIGSETDVKNILENVEQVKEILTALREESLTLTKEQAQTEAPVFHLDVDVQYYWQEVDGVSNKYLASLPVYGSYTKTIQLIEKYTGIVPEMFSLDDIKRAELTLYAGADQGKMTDAEFADYQELTENAGDHVDRTVEDKQEIQKLLENAVSSEAVPGCDPSMQVTDPYPAGVCIVLENDVSFTLCYKNGEIPFEDIFACMKK